MIEANRYRLKRARVIYVLFGGIAVEHLVLIYHTFW